MTYDWTSTEDDYADRMADGYHKVRIEKVMRGSKKKDDYRTQKGDRQLMLVFANDTGDEAACMVCVEGKGVFKLKQLVQRFGLDTDKMKAHGVTPDRFADEQFAKKQLEGREGWIQVTNKAEGFADIEFVKTDDLPAAVLQQTKQEAPPRQWDRDPAVETHREIDAEEIPF